MRKKGGSGTTCSKRNENKIPSQVALLTVKNVLNFADPPPVAKVFLVFVARAELLSNHDQAIIGCHYRPACLRVKAMVCVGRESELRESGSLLVTLIPVTLLSLMPSFLPADASLHQVT